MTTPRIEEKTFEEKSKSEEWGAWKFVSDMLDAPDENGIYQTSKCYEQIHDFVVEQKKKARQAGIDEAVGKLREWIESNEKELSDPYPFDSKYTYCDFVPSSDLDDFLEALQDKK